MEPASGATSMPLRKWAPLGIIGLVAVSAGMLLPQMLPSSSIQPNTQAETKSPLPATKGPLAYKPPDWPEAPSHQGMFLRLGLGTILVLGLCVGTIFFSKRWLGNAPTDAKGPGQLRLIETLPLGQRCWVQLVHVGGQAVLIGGDATGLKTITPLPESFSPMPLENNSDPQTAGMASVLAQRFAATMDRTRTDDKE